MTPEELDGALEGGGGGLGVVQGWKRIVMKQVRGAGIDQELEWLVVAAQVGVETLPDGASLVDFNYAYNPYCAYSERWSCPLTPS